MVAVEGQTKVAVPHETKGGNRYGFRPVGQMAQRHDTKSRWGMNLLEERKGWSMRSTKHVLSVFVLVLGCSAILWPGVLVLPTVAEVGVASTSEAAGYSTDSLEELLESLGLEDADAGELVSALGLHADSDDGVVEEVADAD